MRRLKPIRLILLLTLALVAFIPATSLAQKSVQKPFEPHEELHFEAEFSRALLRNLDVADLRFHASSTPSPSPNDRAYSLTFKADISSKGFFARLFNIKFRERVESIVEPVTFTVQKTTILDETGKRVRATESTFDRSQGKMTWTLRDPNNPASEPRQATAEFSGQLQDVLSAIYFIRMQPLEVGKTFDVFIGDGGRVYRTPVKVVGRKKRMKTAVGRVDALQLNAELFGPERLIDQEKGEFSLWITDDARRIPVRGRVKTDYGTFDINLKRVITTPPAVK